MYKVSENLHVAVQFPYVKVNANKNETKLLVPANRQNHLPSYDWLLGHMPDQMNKWNSWKKAVSQSMFHTSESGRKLMQNLVRHSMSNLLTLLERQCSQFWVEITPTPRHNSSPTSSQCHQMMTLIRDLSMLTSYSEHIVSASKVNITACCTEHTGGMSCGIITLSQEDLMSLLPGKCLIDNVSC